jgi:hypothetical protein
MSLELPILIVSVGILVVNIVFYAHKWGSVGGKE